MKYIVSAGGTGGHIYPAISIIKKIKEIDKDAEILYIGTTNRMEATIVPKEGTANASVYLRDDISGSGSYLNGLYKIKTTHTDSNPLVIGDEMMLPPSSHYYIKVTMCDKLGNDCSPQGYFRIAPTGSSFEAGKIYWIQMRISAKPEDAPGGIEIIND